ncbi:MAG: hypothetical protein MRY59_11815 [Aquisalinus sp.]|nr:hypothetical protein [Aquisalinus sp.]
MRYGTTVCIATLALAGSGFASASALDIPVTDLPPKAEVVVEGTDQSTASISVDTVWDEFTNAGLIVAKDSGQVVGFISASEESETQAEETESL